MATRKSNPTLKSATTDLVAAAKSLRKAIASKAEEAKADASAALTRAKKDVESNADRARKKIAASVKRTEKQIEKAAAELADGMTGAPPLKAIPLPLLLLLEVLAKKFWDAFIAWVEKKKAEKAKGTFAVESPE